MGHRRDELARWASRLNTREAPYSSMVQAENEFFLTQLERYSGSADDQIRDSAIDHVLRSRRDSKTWNRLGWGTLAAGVGLSVLTGGLFSVGAFIGGYAGLLYGGSRSRKEAQFADGGEHFLQQLDDVCQSIDQATDEEPTPEV